MEQHDVIVIGGGISGLVFALESAAAGRSALVLERDGRVGGCLATHRTAAGFWFELGGHTCYDSYSGLASIIDACGLRESVIPRAATRLRLFDGDALVPGANLSALLKVVRLSEVLKSLPRAITAQKDGRTVRDYYSQLVGAGNYQRAVGPLLSAVPSQRVDDFPASMLFKSRSTKRRDYPASFTMMNGLRTIPDSIARQPRIEVALGQAAAAIGMEGNRYAVTTEDGKRRVAPLLALATNPSVASSLLRDVAPDLAARIGRIGEAVVETLGFAVRAEKISLPESSFIVPCDDMFHSMVTRDAVPDAAWRGFAFHFKPGFSREDKVSRATALLHLSPGDLVDVVEQRSVLPSPVLGHAEVTAEIDRLCAGRQLCVTGNWFAGLSIEDCVQRSREEWQRVAA